MAQSVTLHEVSEAEALPLLNLACEDARQGLSVSESVAGCRFFTFEHQGKTILATALRVTGTELWIAGAGGQAAIDLTDLALPVIEAQAGQLQSVAFQTRRRGLVKKAQRHGYIIDGYIMRKTL